MVSTLKRLQDDFTHFAHITSHDLRDPVRQILELCDDAGNANPTHEIHDIKASASQLLERIDLLKHYGLLLQPTRFATTSTKDALDTALQQHKDALATASLTLNGDPLPSLYANSEQLTTLFYALIENALNFSQPYPVISITVNDAKEHCYITVKDNGIGMDMVYLPLIFLPFQRIDPYSKGQGMGLAFAKKIAENHGGDVTCESEEGQGFSISVSLAKKKP